jgi:hypothetical protein
MKKMCGKRGYEFSFSWFFAIIVGAIVIFLAVYITTKIVNMQRTGNEAEMGMQLATLLTPMDTNIEEGKTAMIVVPVETKLFNDCSLETTFGSQDFRALTKSGIGDAWRSADDSVEISFHNKYLFSSAEVHGNKEIYILSKPFKFPFKIADLMMMWSDNEEYCFVNLPWADLKDEIIRLKLKNVQLDSCSPNAKKICFSGSCDITIDSNQKTVTHSGSQPVYYTESFGDNDKYALLYAAIFSDPVVYECQVNRLMARASQISMLYELKSKYLSPKGCMSEPVLSTALSTFKNQINPPNFAGSQNLNSAVPAAQSLKDKNEVLTCRLF